MFVDYGDLDGAKAAGREARVQEATGVVYAYSLLIDRVREHAEWRVNLDPTWQRDMSGDFIRNGELVKGPCLWTSPPKFESASIDRQGVVEVWFASVRDGEQSFTFPMVDLFVLEHELSGRIETEASERFSKLRDEYKKLRDEYNG